MTTMMMVAVACHFRDDYKLWSVPTNPFCRSSLLPETGVASNAENTLEFKFQSSLLAQTPGCLWWPSLCCEPPIHTLTYRILTAILQAYAVTHILQREIKVQNDHLSEGCS